MKEQKLAKFSRTRRAAWQYTYIGTLLGERLCVARHCLAFALIDMGEHALLMHGGQLVFLSVAFLFKCLYRSL